MLSDPQQLRRLMAPELPEGLLAHIDRVVALAGPYAQRHGGDEARARLGAQGHDLLRAVPAPELLARAEARNLALLPAEREQPVLLHGPLAALELRERFAVTDDLVLHAIHWHTTGHPDFSVEAWAIFIADKVDPRKVKRRPALAEVAALAEVSLEAAALRYLELNAARAAAEGWASHPMALTTQQALAARVPRQS